MNVLKDKKQYLKYLLILVVGLVLGWVLFHSSSKKNEAATAEAGPAKHTIWTCSMHPQIRQTKPGKCPICGMDLIPLKEDNDTKIDPNAIEMSDEAMQLANVETSVVGSSHDAKAIRLYGKVEANEQLQQSQTAHVAGRIEQLYVNTEGAPVRKGQTLAMVYSPDLLLAQQELIEAAKNKTTEPEIYAAAKEKLRQWKLSAGQISSIEKSGQVHSRIPITANTNGVVTGKRVNVGDYVNAGDILLDVANLSNVWVEFEAYESDLPFIRQGQKVLFGIQALPGKQFSGNVSFIDPTLDPTTRTVKMRVVMPNTGGLLKPGMFATGQVQSPATGPGKDLIIPASAVLWTGKRSVVYVKQPGTAKPAFEMREIELGSRLNDSYIVQSGLSRGEEIVTQGTFQVDASAQLQGKKSMMSEK